LAVRGDTKGSARPETSAKRPKLNIAAAPKAEPGTEKGQVGKTLRSVYQETVNEEVPSELLDLLGKLS
jgi:hypothetical protein